MNDKKIRTRFAPSPTGFMHVGNLRTALYAWLLARSQGGSFVLRIEDTDRARLVEEAMEVIYRTLRTAGLTHDEGPDVGGPFGPYIQSERLPVYRKYAEQLVASGAAYRCFCEKHEAEEDADGAELPHEASATCACRELDPAAAAARAAAGEPFVIRQKIDREGGTLFSDEVFGEIVIENKVLDDQILLKRDGYPTYNFANVVDDHLMEINCVVRGCEYLSSTPKYNLLYRAFGWEIPRYFHLPLIMGRDAEGNVSKLSKRHGSVSFENLLADGYLPSAIVNYIALLGWSPKSGREIFTLDELAAAFDPAGLNKSPAVFDYAKLAWVNSEHLKALPPERFAEIALPFAGEAGKRLADRWEKVAALLQSRIEVLTEIPEKIGFLVELPEFDVELFNHKKSKCDPSSSAAILAETIPAFEALAAWTPEAITGVLGAYAEKHGVKLGQPMWAVRIAATGCAVTPGGPGELMEILGREESLRRLRLALDRLPR